MYWVTICKGVILPNFYVKVRNEWGMNYRNRHKDKEADSEPKVKIISTLIIRYVQLRFFLFLNVKSIRPVLNLK